MCVIVFEYLSIRSAVSVRQIKRMQGIMSRRPEPVRDSARKMGIYQEIHAASNSTRLTWVRRAA